VELISRRRSCSGYLEGEGRKVLLLHGCCATSALCDHEAGIRDVKSNIERPSGPSCLKGYIHSIASDRHQSRIILPQHVSAKLLICTINAPRLTTGHLPDNIRVNEPAELRKPFGSVIRGDTIGLNAGRRDVVRLPVQGGSAWY
jgi:hypothetical protein